MPMSQAAMDGISANGHRWKFFIHGMKPFTQALGKLNDAENDGQEVADADVEKKVQEIIKIVRDFAGKTDNVRLRDDLLNDADNLEMVEDCGLDEVNFQMGNLYDTFDFHRVLVQS